MILPCTLYVLQKLIAAHPHAVNCRDLDGRHSTPLHFAAGYNRVAVVEYLLQHGADVHAKDKGYVVTTGQFSIVSLSHLQVK
ncbi:hypothetical protein DPMN_167424 [Dreissena polymorpha]|uniref:Uncharacterized protein n=1 Tax=Dreissena polymorpha TaxID=45954 RepID=A0A9D4EYT6_DREPO|nr:hypothetical protein DPMN_167424 [Dreissena polymorpha]